MLSSAHSTQIVIVTLAELLLCVVIILVAEGQDEATQAGDSNDWPLLIEASERYDAITDQWRDRDDLPESWFGSIDSGRILTEHLTEQERALYREIVADAEQAGVFEQLKAGLAKLNFVRPGRNSIGEGAGFGSAGQLRELSMILAIETFVAAWDGDQDRAIRSILDQSQLADVVSQEGGLMYRILANAMRSRRNTAIIVMVTDGLLEGPMLSALLATLREHGSAPLAGTLDRERALQHRIVQAMYDDEKRGDGKTTEEFLREATITIGRLRGLMHDLLRLPNEDDELPTDEAAFREVLETIEFATEEEMHVMIDACLDRFIEDAKRDHWKRELRGEEVEALERELYPEYVLLCDSVPAIASALSLDATTSMIERGIEIMLLVEIYQHEHGVYPESLDAIDADIGPDPRFGTPFGYRRIEGDTYGRGYLLYSYGADGEDNAGTPTLPRRWDALGEEGHGTDFVINVPRGAE